MRRRIVLDGQLRTIDVDIDLWRAVGKIMSETGGTMQMVLTDAFAHTPSLPPPDAIRAYVDAYFLEKRWAWIADSPQLIA